MKPAVMRSLHVKSETRKGLIKPKKETIMAAAVVNKLYSYVSTKCQETSDHAM